MAKGRSAKAKMSSEDGTKETAKRKVRAAADEGDEEEPTLVPSGDDETGGEKSGGEESAREEGGGEENEGEVWDVVEVLIGGGKDVPCRMEECKQTAVAVWTSNTNPDDRWPMCEACQQEDVGGWPEDLKHYASSKDVTSNDSNAKNSVDQDVDSTNEESSTDKSKDTDSDDSIQPEQTKMANDNASDNQGEEDEEEKWEIKKILSQEAVTKSAYIKCDNEKCTLPAFSLYVSKQTGEKWYYCIDCQEEDFGGWPDLKDIPVAFQSLTSDHVQALADKCSKKRSPDMGPFAVSDSPTKANADVPVTNPITPLTAGNTSQAPEGSKTTITPTPAKPTKTKKNPKENAVFMKRHAEWKAAAVKATGDPNVRIVVSKPEAKSLIFQVLYDSFKPMNITQIHTELKATVPSSILKMCLDDMALDKNSENQFYDSDDDEDDAKKKARKSSEASGEDFAGSLCFKGGRNANSSLYYVDHTKQKNNGNGLEPDQRNTLASDLAQAQEEESVLKAKLQTFAKETEQLLSEPTNEEATTTLEVQEVEMKDMRDKLEAARKLKCNEKIKKSIKKRVESLTAQWRKRKRLTMEFLINMEESTEGTISAKKCLAGDGQIDIESDESAIQNAIAYGKKKRSMAFRPPAKKMKLSKGLGKTAGQAGEGLTGGLTADPNFVAVRLDASGQVVRVYLDDDE